MTDPFAPLVFPRGPEAANRFMLAPLTNSQSHEDGTISDEEHTWLAMRGDGGFGAVMTCAASVSATGLGFPGQLGIHRDDHVPGLRRLADELRASGSLGLVQLHHAGVRSPAALIGTSPVGPSDHDETGARTMTTDERMAVVLHGANQFTRRDRLAGVPIEIVVEDHVRRLGRVAHEGEPMWFTV